jgi:hypothetical protein
MRLKHPDYIRLIIEACNKKRADNELSPLLAQSTPANIRRECATVYQERYEKKDEPMLRAFFGPEEHGRKFLAAIQGFDIDRFRPLNKYLRNPDENRISDRNLQLLAWLIDFKHRPFVFGMEAILNEEELALIRKGDSQTEAGNEDEEIQIDEEEFVNPIEKEETQIEEKEPANPIQNEEVQIDEDDSAKLIENELHKISEEPKKPRIPFGILLESSIPKGKFRIIIIFFALVICTGGIYTIWREKQNKQVLMGSISTGCMYWADDHYEAIACNQKRKGTIILPFDEEKMKSFKKITREDTITEWSIGKAYYIKNNNIIEYYTTAGTHPIHVTDSLKVLSRYMFNTHLRKTSDKDSLTDKTRSL